MFSNLIDSPPIFTCLFKGKKWSMQTICGNARIIFCRPFLFNCLLLWYGGIGSNAPTTCFISACISCGAASAAVNPLDGGKPSSFCQHIMWSSVLSQLTLQLRGSKGSTRGSAVVSGLCALQFCGEGVKSVYSLYGYLL